MMRWQGEPAAVWGQERPMNACAWRDHRPRPMVNDSERDRGGGR